MNITKKYTRKDILSALRGILPYAETESESLAEAYDRDGEDICRKEWKASHRKVIKAQQILEAEGIK